MNNFVSLFVNSVMMKCFAVCMLAFLTLCRDAYANFSDDMAKTIQQCCNDGHQFARGHSERDCEGKLPKSSIPVPFESMCAMAKAQCCREYFVKQNDCEVGTDISMSGNSCSSTNGISNMCCVDCSKGASLGAAKGPEACSLKISGSSAEETLAHDAFVKCCEKAAKDWKATSTQKNINAVTLSTIRSTCEDYAPNELCAHHCIPVPGSYKCECNPGYMLMPDGRNCKEVTKNRCKPRNHCQHKCNDNGVEVKCSCRRGYELMPDGKSCQDIDECQLDVPVCLPGTECHNIQGSYRCLPTEKTNNVEKGHCPPGFTWNMANHACDDINECLLPNPPCPVFSCENTVGGYRCNGVQGTPGGVGKSPVEEDRCPPGFQIGRDGECEDVDECAIQTHDCNLRSQFCINTHSSFHCQDKGSKHCPPGFKINFETNKCEDINECEDDDGICRPDQICVNQLGQYDCKPKIKTSLKPSACPDGMRMKEGSNYCEDIDECAEDRHVCDLNQNCLNTNGSYDCHCKLGYELDMTTRACVDVNECATGQHDCLPQAQRCDNTVGSYLCVRIASCGTGYVLQHASGTCEDIDECALGVHNCDTQHYSCFNIRGSFRCIRRRSSTTSTTTTPHPEYEYEYYDSEEEPDNSTSSKTNEIVKETTTSTTTTSTTTSTTTTPKPPPTTTKPTTELPPPIDNRRIEDNTIIPSPPVTFDNTEPTNRDHYETNPLPEIPLPKPTEPVPTPPAPQPTDSEVKPTEWSPIQNPQLEFQPPHFKKPEVMIPPEIPEDDLPSKTEQPPTPRYYVPISNNDSIPPEIEHAESSPRSTEVAPPIMVNVNVGKETATVRGERKDDGSVVIDTGDIPKNEWTKVGMKPKDCPIGFEPDEYGACYDIDECATNRHSCSGLTEICRNTIGGYTCNCAPGFRRDLVTKACDVITTVPSTTPSVTPPMLVPSTTPKSLFWGYPDYRPTLRPFQPRNLCDSGFHFNHITHICEDIDECHNGQASCADVEICVNTHGGYRCDCPPNWRLDDIRHRCVPKSHYGNSIPPGYGNEPALTHRPDTQVPIPGESNLEPEITQIEDRGTVFKCPRGYSLGGDNTCGDINECLTGEAKCGPLQTCTNLPGGYTCSCPTGHKLIGDHQCEDVDECSMAGGAPICSQNADCVNTIGSYQCKCHTGFRSAPVNDKVCVDVDECSSARPGTLCQHSCNNVWGSYRCSCHRGYRLNADNSTCTDIDECKEFKNKLLCVGRCLNEPGSYKCTCPKGYKLSEDKRSCIDIDECETGEATCSTKSYSTTSSDVCVNTRGSFRCHRIACPPGYKLENKHRCTKEERVCLPGDWNCTHQPTTISYNFITFVSNLYIPDGELKLFTMKGPAWTNAKMRFELRLVNVNAPPSVKNKADINAFLLTQKTNFEGLMSLVRALEGPQSIELEMSMDVYTDEQFGGKAVAKLFIYVSEYEF